MNTRRKIESGTFAGFWKNIAQDACCGSNRIILHVNTNDRDFATTPRFHITLFGNNSYWMISTDHAVYNASPHGFDVVLQLPDDVTVEDISAGKQHSFADMANMEAWGVYWFAVVPDYRAPWVPDAIPSVRAWQ